MTTEPTPIVKVDADKRRVYGIALEANVTDLQGDLVTDFELEEAAVRALKNGVVAGREHREIGVGRLIASFPLTRELQSALGMRLPGDRSAWIVGLEITDDATWAAVKQGELTSLSIGGTGRRRAAS